MKLIPLLLAGSLALPSFAAEEAPSAPKPGILDQTIDESAETAAAMNDESVARRSAGSAQILFNYSSLDLVIPNKWGGTFTWLDNPNSSLELEYLSGSLKFPFLIEDLGEMRDARLSLIRRSYIEGGNFNVFYGLAYQTFHVKVSHLILNRIGNLPHLDIMDIETLGGVLGIGNRWVFDHNITIGIDWISLSQGIVRTRKHVPIMAQVSNTNDRHDLDTVIKVASFFPRIVLLKLQVGLTF